MKGKKKIFGLLLVVGVIIGLLFVFQGATYAEDIKEQISKPIPASEDIVIIEVDRYSYENIGRVTPGPEWRRFFPQFIENLEEAEPKVIAFDFTLEAETRYDEKFFSTVKKWIDKRNNILVGATREKVPAFVGDQAGHIFFRYYKNDRETLVLEPIVRLKSKKWILALSLAVVLRYLRDKDLSMRADFVFSRELRLEKIHIENKKNKNVCVIKDIVFIRYAGPNKTFKRFSFYDVWKATDGFIKTPQGRISLKELFEGKIVLVGGSMKDPSTGQFLDRHNTYFGPMDGVELYANAVNTFLKMFEDAGIIDK